MWLSNSSIGRKVVMSVTGIALVLFLTFHMAMNLVALFSEDAYNMICEFLGANWYALVATAGLAALFVIHIIYAFWLTMQNRAARGSERYAVNVKPKLWNGHLRTCLSWVLLSLPDWLFILPISGTKCSLPKLSVFMIWAHSVLQTVPLTFVKHSDALYLQCFTSFG